MRIDDVQRAVDAYRRLDPLGRRLFRDETALETRPRRKRKAKVVAAEPKPRKARAIAAAEPIPTGTVQ